MTRLVLLLLLCVPWLVSGINIDSAKFLDPYTGRNPAGVGDALLDINVETLCPNNLIISVQIPTTPTAGTNAIFDGPSFPFRLIAGVSKHVGFNGGNAVPTSVQVAWDLSTHTLSFTGFGPGVGYNAIFNTFVDGNPDWYNINFDIPDFLFQDPALPDNPLTVPLKLVPLPSQAAPLTIALVDPSDFVVTLDTERCGGAGPHGDPVFAGFQGQEFQFHGLPDEHFNLVSSPDLQLNSHFVYLSSGKCDYNDTDCFTHPGTYMDVLGFSIAETHIKLVAGTHDAGLRIWVNDVELRRGTHIKSLSNNVTGALKYHQNGHVTIQTDIMGFEVVNSDMFFNIKTTLNNQQLLRAGHMRHTVTDRNICKTNSETYDYQLVEATVAKKYPVNTPLHGLMGQTWRNVKVCGRDWMGTVQDYLVSDLFASDNHYNYFKW